MGGTAMTKGTTRDFIRRHSRLMTFFGAFIVFATFIAKETISDSYKQKSEITEKALRDLDESRFRDTMLVHILHLESGASTTRPLDAAAQLDATLAKLQESCRSLLFTTGRLYFLGKTLKNDDDAAKSSELDEGVAQLKMDVNTLRENHAVQKASEEEVKALEDRKDRLAEAITDHEIQTTKEADESEKRAAALAHQWTIASWVLYTIGWGLGLVGRLFSVEGLVTGGD
jgi:hypothetical protein